MGIKTLQETIDSMSDDEIAQYIDKKLLATLQIQNDSKRKIDYSQWDELSYNFNEWSVKK